MRLGRVQDAEPSLSRAIALSAGNAEAEFDLALMLLERGQFERAWKHYEARARVKENGKEKKPPARHKVPQWAGEPLAGKSILIQGEQGLGDILQFSRYVPIVAARGAQVTFLVPSILERLLAPFGTAAKIVSKVASRTPFDYRSLLMSLPGICGTELETIPRTEGPYLFAEPERRAHWRAVLGDAGFKIAIGWQGNPKAKVDKGRSIPVAAFAPLARLPGVRLISLQKENGLDQLAHLPEGMTVERLGPDFDAGPDAFIDTAAVIENCDMVVTSDTSLAHLAGALDAPTWVGLSTTADWRWLRDRDDSPWYRSMTLFRQRVAGDWNGVFKDMAEALREPLAKHGKTKS